MGEGLFQPMHLLVIFAIALLVFGPKKLPELGKGLGEAIRGFKDAFRGTETTQAKTSETKALPDTKGPGESSDQSKS
jgi:sec-independent protein translocase protein TatA